VGNAAPLGLADVGAKGGLNNPRRTANATQQGAHFRSCLDERKISSGMKSRNILVCFTSAEVLRMVRAPKGPRACEPTGRLVHLAEEAPLFDLVRSSELITRDSLNSSVEVVASAGARPTRTPETPPSPWRCLLSAPGQQPFLPTPSTPNRPNLAALGGRGRAGR